MTKTGFGIWYRDYLSKLQKSSKTYKIIVVYVVVYTNNNILHWYDTFATGIYIVSKKDY